jgi:hypothetical protein
MSHAFDLCERPDPRTEVAAEQVDAGHLHTYVDEAPQLTAIARLAGWLRGLGLETSLMMGVICGTRAVTDYRGYRGCPREPEMRAILAERGIRVPVAAPEGDPS